jgi:predicted enzyme related to lactoylglutathione lyase
MAQPVVHFEVHGKDGKKLEGFYAKIFVWSIDSNNPMKYALVAAADGGIGGGIAQSEGPMVTFYVNVPDVAAALAAAEALGATTVMPATAVPGGPEIAQFSDPEGNVIGLTKM